MCFVTSSSVIEPFFSSSLEATLSAMATISFAYMSKNNSVNKVRLISELYTHPRGGTPTTLLGLRFSITGFFWVGKFGIFGGWLDLSRDFLGYSKQSEDFW